MRHRRLSSYFPVFFLLLDLAVLNVAFLLANWLRFDTLWQVDHNYPLLLMILNITWTGVYFFVKLYDSARESLLLEYINRLLTALLVNIGLIFAFWVMTKSYQYSREHLFFTYVIFSVLLIAWRSGLVLLLKHYRQKGFNIRRVAIVGSGPSSESLYSHFMSRPQLGYSFVGFFGEKKEGDKRFKGSIQHFYVHARNNPVDIVFCCLPKLYSNEIKELVDFAENNLIKIKLISDFEHVSDRELAMQKYGSVPVVNVSSIPLDSVLNRMVKRAFDMVFSGVIITFILSWLIPIVGLFIKLESKGPIFFKQTRHGQKNRLFLCWKFRTMVVNHEADSKQATKNDPRVTAIGKFLRQTSIDELPQFINVFLGDMSVVGPRPHPIKLNEMYAHRIDRFSQRHAVKPGITGLAQAKGYRGETSTWEAMYGRVKLDRFYVKNWTLFLDLKIIFLTVLEMVGNNENAY